LTLSNTEKAIILKWIEDGAVYKPHWSFVKPEMPKMPADLGEGAVNPIDYFVRARLDREGLEPSPEADKALLLRRVSLDLTGLPPTPEELEAFLNDSSPDAY